MAAGGGVLRLIPKAEEPVASGGRLQFALVPEGLEALLLVVGLDVGDRGVVGEGLVFGARARNFGGHFALVVGRGVWNGFVVSLSE